MKHKWGERSRNEKLLFESILRSAAASARIENIQVTSEQLRQYEFEDLLYRRQEIVEIIRNHPYCTFDFIYRRFINQVSSKSIHNDLLTLQIKGFIHKAGKTRGAMYVVQLAPGPGA